MLKIVAKCDVKDEKRTDFVQSATELIDKSREDAGCISYELFHDFENPNIYFFIEEWKTPALAEQHSKTEHFVKYVPIIQGCLNGKFEISKLQKSL